MDTIKISSEIDRWYRFYKESVPPMSSWRFPVFASGVSSMILRIAGTSALDNFSFGVDDQPTAYIDFNSKRISLPLAYFDEEFFNKIDSENAEFLSIACINGSLLHEGLHARFTCMNLPDMFAQARLEPSVRTKTMGNYGRETVFRAIGIFEDLYIETIAEKWSQFWLQTKNDLLIASQDFADLEVAIKENPKDVDAALGLALLYKPRSMRDEPIFQELPMEARELLEKVTSGDKLGIDVRSAMALNFIRLFDPTPKGDGDGKGEGDGEDEEKLDFEGKISEADVEKFIKSVNGSKKKSFNVKLHAIAEAFTSEVEAAVESKTEKMELSKTISPEFSSLNVRTPEKIEMDKIISRDSSASTIGDWKKYLPFSRYLRSLMTTNTTPGIPTTRGSRIVNTRLYRIATDQKIFGPATEIHSKAKPQVVLLVDLSGSTGNTAGEGRAIFQHELDAAYGIFTSLRNDGIPCAVFGHTDRYSTPVYFLIASYQMKGPNTLDIDAQFTKASRVDLAENYDGVIIKRMGDEFVKRPGKRVLIVLSDGIPHGPGYGGNEASRHTSFEVAKLRKDGIVVFCVAVVRHCVRQNAGIYGEKWTVDASTNLDAELQRVVMSIVE